MERVFVDTGAWYAIADANNPHHRTARAYMKRRASPLVTTNFVLDETLTLVLRRLGHRAAVASGQAIRASVRTTLLAVAGPDEEQAWRLFQEPRGEWSFTDCTSFAVMRRIGVTRAFAFDGDFRAAGFTVVPGD